MKNKLNKKLVELIFTKYSTTPFTLSELQELHHYGIQTILNTCLELSTYHYRNNTGIKTPVLTLKSTKTDVIHKLNTSSPQILYDIFNIDLIPEIEIDVTNTHNLQNIGYVYCYYYPSYRDLAEYNDVQYWNCKIGQTSRVAPLLRITEQLNASTPEKPIVSLLIKCNNPLAIEQYLHNYFKINNRHIDNTFNNEWFLTNHTEVEHLVRQALSTINK